MENQQEQMENLSPEELVKRKEEMKQFFEEAVPFLEAQHKYEKLVAEISEFKYRRLYFDTQAMSLMYQMQNGPEQEQEAEKTEESKRKLKKG
jgi:uncharacterized protein (DUF2236 family)